MNRKEELKRQIAAHTQGIEDEVEALKSTGKKYGLIALAAGGAFFLTYSIARGIAAGRTQKYELPDEPSKMQVIKQPAPRKSGFRSKIMGIIMTELAVILIGVAKKQFSSFISKLNLHDEEDSE